jgi:hypothetical protein
MDDINLLVWYGNRELENVPPHFHKASTEIKEESLFWVRTKLSGRYAINSIPLDVTDDNNPFSILDLKSYVFFEDERDLILYELKWAGSK